MNKSVLVIDTPERCVECPLLYRSEDIPLGNCTYQMTWDCRMKPINVEDGYITNPMYNKPDWCPLTPLPEPKNLLSSNSKSAAEEILKYSYTQGYNACLDDLQKGTEK